MKVGGAGRKFYIRHSYQSKRPMLRIDMHSHIIPSELPRFSDRFGYEGFIHLEHHRPGYAQMMIGDKFFREIGENCWNPEKRIEDCERNNIDVQVLCTIPVMFNYWAKGEDALVLAEYLNDDLAKVVAKYPRRFVGLATVPLQDTELAVKELERCVKELGLAGVQIGSHVNDKNLSDPALFPFFEACQELGASVFVHPWDMMGKADMQKYWLPWLVGMPAETSRAICSMIFGGVLEKLPDLRVCFSHGGGSFPGTLGRIEHGFNCRPDLVAVDNDVNPKAYCGRFWVDSIIFDGRMLDRIIELFGSDRVCLGSDYPFPLGELETGKLIESQSYDEPVRADLFHNAALAWLNMKKEQFMPEH